MSAPSAVVSHPLRLARPVAWAVAATAAVVVVGLRLRAMHAGLLYPDGYQYLLMARGIGEHLQPVATLGHGGDTLAPSADAAASPTTIDVVITARSGRVHTWSQEERAPVY